MIADSISELHLFAAMLQLPRSWFHATAKYPHYDITSPVRLRAIAFGAQAVSTREIVARVKALAQISAVCRTVTPEMRQLGLFD
jgi:hypothetical protein